MACPKCRGVQTQPQQSQQTQEPTVQHQMVQENCHTRNTLTTCKNDGNSEIQAELPGGALQTQFRLNNTPYTVRQAPVPGSLPIPQPAGLVAPPGGLMARSIALVAPATAIQAQVPVEIPQSALDTTSVHDNPFFLTVSTPVQPLPPPSIPRHPAALPSLRHSSPSMPLDIRNALAEISTGSSDDSDDETSSPLCQKETSQQKVAQRQMRTAASDVWTFFHTADNERICKLCKLIKCKNSDYRVFKYSTKTGTGVLRNHLCACHIDVWIHECDLKKLKIKGTKVQVIVADYQARMSQCNSAQTLSSTRPRFMKEGFVTALMEFIISDDQALYILENEKFRALLLFLHEELQDSDILHRNLLHTQIISTWKQYLVDLKNEMKNQSVVGKISLTMDVWSDENLSPFMGVTAHRIDMTEVHTPAGTHTILKFKSYVIGFHHIPGRHTGQHLAQALWFIVDCIGISSKLGWITMDNASNNSTCIDSFSRSLYPQVTFDPVDRRIRCFPHIVNLACQAVITEIMNIQLADINADDYVPDDDMRTWDSITILHTTIRAIRSSSLRCNAFSKTCQHLGLKDNQLLPDVATRWSSTYIMIQRVLSLQPAIIEYLCMNPDMIKTPLRAQDWTTLRTYASILVVPHAFQQVVSAEKTPTLCEVMPSFNAMITKWQQLQDKLPTYYHIIEAGILKLTQYQDCVMMVPSYMLSILLNPSMKLDWFKQNMSGRVEEMRDLFFEHLLPYRETAVRLSPNKNHRSIAQGHDFDLTDDPNLILGLGNLNLAHVPESYDLHTEIEAYFLDTHQMSSSILFWQENRFRYPTIFHLALDILPIQGSAVPCEQMFSSAKETMTLQRNRINHDLMEALQMLKFSYNHGHTEINFTRGLGRADEVEYLTQLNIEQTCVPEEINLFISSLNPTAVA